MRKGIRPGQGKHSQYTTFDATDDTSRHTVSQKLLNDNFGQIYSDAELG